MNDTNENDAKAKKRYSRLLLLTALIAGAATGGCYPYYGPGTYTTLAPGETSNPSSYSGGSYGISNPNV
ncbi:hypothetical protein GCM10011321_13980 [Youhaiella tibetensis]|uniref:Uncharacterized protein n=1 Tax=Paradevosia tibetensis TaxID=1447062 RepID=A0A5B9DNA8_9HYPH|nr:hypothetical protein [Youhaiella tibetensis]AKR55338.1 hypothetical protein XM25_05865 [Devosia sp. H5989]QEE20472.1 hypothetical protein FNA67_09970 [Youhaiella tibetensis]GGF23847.1 hypothetical protein GCM10011321_13980 [Youhaiella tibetensis]